MSDYYIRITDEEPVEMDRGIRFRYDGTGSEAEFTIVDDEAYNGLVEQVNLFSNNFSGAVNYSLDNILESKVVPKADKCVQIVEDITNSNSESITFTEIKNVIMEYVSQSQLSTLTSTVTSISNSITSILGRLTSLETNSATKSQLASLTQTVNTKENLSNKTSSWNSSTNDTRYPTEKLVKSSLDNKSDKTHTHTGWKSVTLGGGWTSDDCWCVVNEDLHLAHYHIKTSFASATANKKYEWGSSQIGTVPSKYRPAGARYGICRTTNDGYGPLWVTSDGKIGAEFSKGWASNNAQTVYGDIWWNY